MRFGRGRIWLLLGVSLVVPLTVILGLWLLLLASRDTLNHPLAKRAPWPVACNRHGCITTRDWRQHYEARQLFASLTQDEEPTSEEALTTTIHHHLVAHAFLRTPLTEEDAQRYRERILQADDEELILDTTGLTLQEYDTVVLLPLLQQEALRQQRGLDTFDALFRELAEERTVLVLPWRLSWEKGAAQVVRK